MCSARSIASGLSVSVCVYMHWRTRGGGVYRGIGVEDKGEEMRIVSLGRKGVTNLLSDISHRRKYS